MELLIPGLILVALMVFASTRIKRAAAQAFEAEQITGDGFTLSKPDGFLHKINNSEYPFEAYSKQFGTGDLDKVRAAVAVVVIDETSLSKAAAREKERLSVVNSVDEFELGESHCLLVGGETERDGGTFKALSKLIQNNGRVFTLRIEVLQELAEDLSPKTDKMLTSFITN